MILIYRIIVDIALLIVGGMYGAVAMFWWIDKKFIKPYQKLNKEILSAWEKGIKDMMEVTGVRTDGSIRSPIQVKPNNE